MSSDPPAELSEEEVGQLHRALLVLRDELDAALGGARDAAKPVDLDEPIGRISRIDAIAQQQMARSSREGLALRATQVRSALERHAEGGYGACVSCEESIGFARLEARPEAPFCITCQSARERR